MFRGLFRKLLWMGLAVGVAAFFGVGLFGVRLIRHQQADAARAAEQFADLAFVRSEFAKARDSALPEFQKVLSTERLAEEVAGMHPKGPPTEVHAVEYEPMPGQRAMMIYLVGTHGDETFHYRFIMAGDEPTGYRVGAFYKGSGPYPPTARRPL